MIASHYVKFTKRERKPIYITLILVMRSLFTVDNEPFFWTDLDRSDVDLENRTVSIFTSTDISSNDASYIKNNWKTEKQNWIEGDRFGPTVSLLCGYPLLERDEWSNLEKTNRAKLQWLRTKYQ